MWICWNKCFFRWIDAWFCFFFLNWKIKNHVQRMQQCVGHRIFNGQTHICHIERSKKRKFVKKSSNVWKCKKKSEAKTANCWKVIEKKNRKSFLNQSKKLLIRIAIIVEYFRKKKEEVSSVSVFNFDFEFPSVLYVLSSVHLKIKTSNNKKNKSISIVFLLNDC